MRSLEKVPRFLGLRQLSCWFRVVGFVDEKVVDLEAQRRADELQAAKEQLDASGMIQQQPDLSSLGSSPS